MQSGNSKQMHGAGIYKLFNGCRRQAAPITDEQGFVDTTGKLVFSIYEKIMYLLPDPLWIKINICQ